MGGLRFGLSRGSQVKHLKFAIQSMSKIGSELLIECVPAKVSEWVDFDYLKLWLTHPLLMPCAMQLILRVVNSSRSAFFAVTFSSSFFDLFELYDSELLHSSVLLKQILATFRTPRCASYEWDLQMTDSSSHLSIKVVAENHMMKSYRLDCLDSEILNANVDKESYATSVIAEAGELNRLLSSFQSNLAELTIIANPENLLSGNIHQAACQFQSFIDKEKAKPDQSLCTSLAINTRSLFLHYQHKSDQAQDVTLNLKDFRTMLSLCEHLGSNILIRFDCPGSPLVAEPHIQGHIQPTDELQSSFSAELVLATLLESQLEHQMQRAPEEMDQMQQNAPPNDEAAANNQHANHVSAPIQRSSAPSHPGQSNVIPSHQLPPATAQRMWEGARHAAPDPLNNGHEDAMPMMEEEEEQEEEPEALPRSPAMGSLRFVPRAPPQAASEAINLAVDAYEEEDELPGTPAETEDQAAAGFIC